MSHLFDPDEVRRWARWLRPGLGFKRWLSLLMIGIAIAGVTIAQLIVDLYRDRALPEVFNVLTLRAFPPTIRLLIGSVLAVLFVWVALRELNRSVLAPLSRIERGRLLDRAYAEVLHTARMPLHLNIVALGGGTGLPSVLRGFRGHTDQLTAIVTMADDGGSSGKLRREFGVLPPGDVRNNIAALADDEDMMVRLFQYRFGIGGLEGHSFGNLFLTALANLTGSMESAIIEAGRVLAIQGRVLPSSTIDVHLTAEVRTPEGRLVQVAGESRIPEVGGRIERVSLSPDRVPAYPEAIRAILAADLIVIGPGSLYTSILPNLLVDGIAAAVLASPARTKIYICNIAMQKGETDGFTAADHVMALEQHIGQVFDAVLTNNHFPAKNQGITRYVPLMPPDHEVRTRYHVIEADLTDNERPWRHDPDKLRTHLLAAVSKI